MCYFLVWWFWVRGKMLEFLHLLVLSTALQLFRTFSFSLIYAYVMSIYWKASTSSLYSLLIVRFVTECARSAQCSGHKHHFDACTERVLQQHENPEHKGPKEDCVEECTSPTLLNPSPLHPETRPMSGSRLLISVWIVFHLQHCATQCAAPKLFRILK